MNLKMKFEKDWGQLALKYKLLSDVCYFSKERVSVESLTPANYISTENMVSNKGGIIRATKLPSAKTVSSFEKGDILISNIRPYFKKIWQAEFDGGCSNDVLVIRARREVNPRFLYYVLSNDSFFNYSTSTSKGTKMPRGDKLAIMKYAVPHFSFMEQVKIADILSAIDNKISINSKINHHLVA